MTGAGDPATPTRSGRANADPESMSSPTNARRSEDVMSNTRVPGNVHPARYSEDIADWNIGQANKSRDGVASAARKASSEYSSQPATNSALHRDEAPVNFSKPSSSSGAQAGRSRKDSVPRKPIASPPPVAVADTSTHYLERSSSTNDLRKEAKLESSALGAGAETPASPTTTRDISASKHVKNYAVKDSPAAPTLSGVVDLRNTVDTTVDEKWAPAVLREVVNKDIHHIREEVVTREIHNHHVFHRILPIIDVEVLPTRHFVPDGKGGLVEISEHEIPGRTGPYRQNWAIVETASRDHVVHKPRQFTARHFSGNEGDYKEYISAAGVPTTETTWIHPPVLEEYSELTRQTVPFYFGSPDPRDDGLRIHAPRGPVSGVSRMVAEGIGHDTSAPTSGMSKLSINNSATEPGVNNFSPSSSSSRNTTLGQSNTATTGRAGFSNSTQQESRLAQA